MNEMPTSTPRQPLMLVSLVIAVLSFAVFTLLAVPPAVAQHHHDAATASAPVPEAVYLPSLFAAEEQAAAQARSRRSFDVPPPADRGPQHNAGHRQKEAPAMSAQADLELLIVDDELEIRELLVEYFGRHGFRSRSAESAAAARRLVEEHLPDVAILDVHMRGEDGLSLARWMRETQPRLGIVMLTTAADTVDRIVGLEMGADDYLPKPFELRELLARVKSLGRRLALASAAPRADEVKTGAGAAPPAPVTQRISFGKCLLDLDQRRLLGQDGADVAVTAAEFDLLSLFARSPNRPLNRDQIMEQAHNRGWDVFDRSIDLRIMRLRRKVERNPDKPEVIKTVRNVGYVFVPETVAVHGRRA
jgi:DNA-binding response OmpR family regulator